MPSCANTVIGVTGQSGALIIEELPGVIVVELAAAGRLAASRTTHARLAISAERHSKGWTSYLLVFHDQEGPEGGALDAVVGVAELVADAQAEAAEDGSDHPNALSGLTSQLELTSLAGNGALEVSVLVLVSCWWA